MVLRSKHPSVSCPVPNKALLWSPSSSWPPHLWQAVPVVCGVDRRDDRQSMSWFTKHRMFIGWRQSFPSLQVEHALCPCCGLFFFFFFWLWVLVKLLSHVRLSATPMACTLSDFSVHGIFQARVLERVAISFSRRSSRPREWPRVSRIAGRCFTVWATRGVQISRGFLEEGPNTVLY